METYEVTGEPSASDVTSDEESNDVEDNVNPNQLSFNFEEALDSLNEADDCEVECVHCHEMFPKDECLKECGKFVCKECASKKSLTEESEDVDNILADIDSVVTT
jgi:formylmethanofuran dehydrogenase subunit E